MKVKLVRDNIVALDELEVVRPANTRAGRLMGLLAKLHEEAAEIVDAPNDPEEYADLLQVLTDLMILNQIDFMEVSRILETKRARKGGFSRGMVLTRYDSMEQMNRRFK